jgi:sugar (pentulose or hexulose) kinase
MFSLGIDVGTSGIRGVIMDKNHHIAVQAAVSLSPGITYQAMTLHETIIGYSQDPQHWWNTLQTLFSCLAVQFDLKQITHLALDGTSGTVLLADNQGKPLTPALMYNDQRAVTEAQTISRIAPDDTAAMGATSGLAKVLWLVNHWQKQNSRKSFQFILNQADWLLGKLSGQFGISDHNNALKMGYDAINHCWPPWLPQLIKKWKK